MVDRPQQSTLQRKWKLEINTGTDGSPIWTTVKGLAEMTPKSAEPNLEDDNVYEDDGYTGQTKTALTWSIEGKVMRRTVAGSTTSYDPGQERLRYHAETLGPEGVAHVRWYDRDGGAEAYEGYAEVSWEPDGGSPTDLESVSFTISGKGKRDIITNPAATPIAVPIVTGLSPAGGTTAGGTLVKISGQRFVGVTGPTAVKFGANNATSYSVYDSQTIYAVAPAGTAGAKDVTVVNTTGTSPSTGTGNDYTYA